MTSFVRSIISAAVLASCTGGSASSIPANLPSSEDMCRCNGLGFHLALVRIETAPTPHTDRQWGSGDEFEMTILQGLPTTHPDYEASSVAPVGSRVRVRRYKTSLDGSRISYYSPRTLEHIGLSVGMEILVGYRLARGIEPPMYLAEPLRVDPATNTLSIRWSQFPVGTPASQILDPTEWGNPARGCDPDCRPALPQVTTDAAPDVGPLDASDVPTRG